MEKPELERQETQLNLQRHMDPIGCQMEASSGSMDIKENPLSYWMTSEQIPALSTSSLDCSIDTSSEWNIKEDLLIGNLLQSSSPHGELQNSCSPSKIKETLLSCSEELDESWNTNQLTQAAMTPQISYPYWHPLCPSLDQAMDPQHQTRAEVWKKDDYPWMSPITRSLLPKSLTSPDAVEIMAQANARYNTLLGTYGVTKPISTYTVGDYLADEESLTTTEEYSGNDN